jgi:hypothetical protein
LFGFDLIHIEGSDVGSDVSRILARARGIEGGCEVVEDNQRADLKVQASIAFPDANICSTNRFGNLLNSAFQLHLFPIPGSRLTQQGLWRR